MQKASHRRATRQDRAQGTGSSGAPPREGAGCSPPGSSLILRQEPQRLAALLHEHGQLLSKIKQRKAERERLEARITEAATAARSSALPLVEELVALDGRLHALFTELLARKGQPRRTQKIVRSVYSFLQETGELSPEGAGVGAPGSAAPSAGRAPEDTPDSAAEGEAPPWATGGVTARRPSAAGADSSLRSLYHRLAEALHPDKVQDEQQKAERTDAMKELTQAYQAGDLALLIELERTWLAPREGAGRKLGAPERTEEEELARRCAELEKTNRALRLQLDEVNRALRALRRSPPAEFVSELKRMARGSKKDPVAAWLDSLREQREGLSELLAFVRSYHEGRIDIWEFERGPRTARWDEEESDVDELDLLQALIAGLAERAQSPRSRRRSRRSSPLRDGLF